MLRAALADETIEAIDARMREVMGVVNGATAELVSTIASALESGAWEGVGIRSPEHWVMLRAGVSAGRAHRLVGMARRLAELPATAAMFGSGRLSEDQTAVLCRRLPVERDAEIAEIAPVFMVPQLQRLLATIPQPPAPDPDPERYHVRFGFNGDGDFWSRALLPPDVGAAMQRWLEAARDQLFHARHPDADDQGAAKIQVAWTDALAHAIEVGLAALAQQRSGLRAQVLYHLDLDQALSALVHQGPPLPDALRRLLVCDTDLRVVLEAGGVPVAMSIPAPTVNDRLRVLVEQRDQGCRVPGCAQRRWLHIHHLRHVEDGGPTRLDNLCALCPFHHRLHHTGLLGITGDPTRPDGLVFTDRHGRPIGPSPPHPPPGTPAAAARTLGIATGPYTPPPGERLDLRWIAWN